VPGTIAPHIRAPCTSPGSDQYGARAVFCCVVMEDRREH